MVKRAAVAGNARVYDITGTGGADVLPALALGQRRTALQKRARRKAEFAAAETALLDDFAFPTLSTKVKESADGHVFAAGAYAPQLHVYDTRELSLKFKRHVDAEIVDFQILGPDWRKFALLHADRYVDIHSQYGSHYRLRVPRPGRDLVVHKGTADLYVAGAGSQVWRLNLEQGRFMPPLETKRPGISCAGLAPPNRLLALGGEDGVVEIWDTRVGNSKAAGGVDVGVHVGVSSAAVSTIRFDERDGVTMCAATSSGQVAVYDLRSARPRIIRQQGYGLPVRTVRMLRDGRVLSSCRKSIKVWDRNRSGRTILSLEPDADINHVCIMGNSGVLAAACDAPRVRAYYAPTLGPAPKWCAFLDTYTEELEDDADLPGVEKSDVIPAGHKFVAGREELEKLGLEHLLGTPACVPVAHGFYIPAGTWRRAVTESEPFAYEKYVAEKAAERLEALRKSRIGKVRTTKKAQVNADVAERWARGGKSRRAEIAKNLLDDPRFAAMFNNPAFKVNPEAERYKQLNPSGVAAGRRGKGREDECDEIDSDEEQLEADAAKVLEDMAHAEDGDEDDDKESDGNESV